MARAYARFSQLSHLRLDLLERVISRLPTPSYTSDLYDLLYDEAESITGRLEDELCWYLLPAEVDMRIDCPEPRPYLPLEAWLVKLVTITQIALETAASDLIETILDQNMLDHDPGDSHIDWLNYYIKGRFRVSGVWGTISKKVVDRDQIGELYVTSGETLAGATSIVLTTAVTCRGGEIFWDSDRNQHLIATSNSGATITLDQWGTPETTIPTGTELRYCGALDKQIERMVLVGAYLNAYRKATVSPEPGALESEKADKHAYKRGGTGGGTASPMDSYLQEWAELEQYVKRIKAPKRWT